MPANSKSKSRLSGTSLLGKLGTGVLVLQCLGAALALKSLLV